MATLESDQSGRQTIEPTLAREPENIADRAPAS